MGESKITISNTTPLINFAQIGRRDLLEELFGKITVPAAVVEELSEKGTLFPKIHDVWESEFISVCENASPSPHLIEFEREIHFGEAHCLALALQRPQTRLILDDVAARNAAQRHGLRMTGTLGCLLIAKRKGLLPKVAPVIGDLRNEARFWIHRNLEMNLLEIAGEL